MPRDSHARQGFESLNDQFSAGRLLPVQFAIEGDPDQVNQAVARFREPLTGQTVGDGLGGAKPAYLPTPTEDWVRWSDNGTPVKVVHANDGMIIPPVAPATRSASS